jgi:hypothetical protein
MTKRELQAAEYAAEREPHEDIVALCRTLASCFAGTDLPGRLIHTMDTQRRQRECLERAAQEIERLRMLIK